MNTRIRVRFFLTFVAAVSASAAAKSSATRPASQPTTQSRTNKADYDALTRKLLALAAAPVGANLISKSFEKMNVEAGDQSDYIKLVVLLQNNSGKDIRAFKGRITLTNFFDDRIASFLVVYEKPFANEKCVKYDGRLNFNQFLDEDQALKSADERNLFTSLEGAIVKSRG